jgi:hypothetical protein
LFFFDDFQPRALALLPVDDYLSRCHALFYPGYALPKAMTDAIHHCQP